MNAPEHARSRARRAGRGSRPPSAARDRGVRRRRLDDARARRAPALAHAGDDDARHEPGSPGSGARTRRGARCPPRLGTARARRRRVGRRALPRQPGRPLLLLQDQPLRPHPRAHRRHDRFRHEHRRPLGLPSGTEGGRRARRRAPVRRSRPRQGRRLRDRRLARPDRPRAPARAAVPREPRRDRHRDRCRRPRVRRRGRVAPRRATAARRRDPLPRHARGRRDRAWRGLRRGTRGRRTRSARAACAEAGRAFVGVRGYARGAAFLRDRRDG